MFKQPGSAMGIRKEPLAIGILLAFIGARQFVYTIKLSRIVRLRSTVVS
jgi:uncharacterized integral membrane protein